MVWPVSNRWNKYMIISVCLHIALLSVPLSMVAKQKIDAIDVSLLMENEPAPKPELEKRPPPPKPERPKPMRLEEKPPPAQRPEEPKDVKAQVISPGEKTVMQVAPGVGDAETGVAIAGARVGDGGTEIGGSMPGGTGTGKGYGYGGEGAGPVDAQFGRGDGPRFAYREMPDYPYAARRLGKEGKVLLALYIDHKGKLEKVEVIEVSDQMFVDAALEAVRKSRFHPAKRHGVAVRSRSVLPIRFGF